MCFAFIILYSCLSKIGNTTLLKGVVLMRLMGTSYTQVRRVLAFGEISFLGVFYETGSSFGQSIIPPKIKLDTGLVLTNTGIGYRASLIIFGVRLNRHRRNLLQLRFGSMHRPVPSLLSKHYKSSLTPNEASEQKILSLEQI
jgi:hypothetical protein